MAPVNADDTTNLAVRTSSFDLSTYLESLSLSAREALSHPQAGMSKLSKRLFTRVDTNQDSNLLVARTDVTQSADYGGAIDPNDINMKGFQALFAVIGALFVLGAIWFFFWAKNGGFKFRKGDWDDYKSTVLRRKGPNGTTLSNATKSTILGGGSVVGDGYSDRDMYADETSTVYTGTMTELSSSTAPIIKEKRNKKARSGRNETAKERKQREMKQANYKGGHDADVRAYMKEKPARVGGINAASDTMHYGTDYTETEGSTYSASHVGSHTHRSSTPSSHLSVSITAFPIPSS